MLRGRAVPSRELPDQLQSATLGNVIKWGIDALKIIRERYSPIKLKPQDIITEFFYSKSKEMFPNNIYVWFTNDSAASDDQITPDAASGLFNFYLGQMTQD